MTVTGHRGNPGKSNLPGQPEPVGRIIVIGIVKDERVRAYETIGVATRRETGHRVAEGGFQRGGGVEASWMSRREIARCVESNRRVKVRGYIAPNLLRRVQVSPRIWRLASGIVPAAGDSRKVGGERGGICEGFLQRPNTSKDRAAGVTALFK